MIPVAYSPAPQSEEDHPYVQQPRRVWCTMAKAKRMGLHVFEKSAYAGSVALISISLAGILPFVPCAFSSIVLCSGGEACRNARYKIRDFEDPVELQSMKENALRSTFHEITSAYKWNEIHELLPPTELARKCQLHVLSHFEHISQGEINTYVQRGLVT